MTPHCFHDASPPATARRPLERRTEACCWCGQTRVVAYELQPTSGHGPAVVVQHVVARIASLPREALCPARP